MPKVPFKCNKCGAPIELDPYRDFVKCNYCGSANIFDNGRLISKSERYLNKVAKYLPKLKQRKVFIPLIIFSILVPVGIYKVNYIDDFLVKECQIRTRESNDGDFISKRNYKKCLRKIKREWANLASSTCIDMKKYATFMDKYALNSYSKDDYRGKIFEEEVRQLSEEKFKKETLRVGMDWLKKNEILKNGFFFKAKCIKNLKKVAHLIFGRSKSSFE